MATKNKQPKDITQDFTGDELRKLGLPARCDAGEVLEDRLIERVDGTRKVKRNGETITLEATDEVHFIIVRMHDGIWGFSYTKHESGRVTFDKITTATLYEYKTLLVQADEAA